MKLSSEIVNGIAVVRVSENVDMYSASLFRDTLDTFFDQGLYRIIINLHKINHIDSSGIAVIIAFNNKLVKVGSKLRIVVDSQKSILFHHFSIDKQMSILTSEETAIMSF